MLQAIYEPETCVVGACVTGLGDRLHLYTMLEVPFLQKWNTLHLIWVVKKNDALGWETACTCTP